MASPCQQDACPLTPRNLCVTRDPDLQRNSTAYPCCRHPVAVRVQRLSVARSQPVFRLFVASSCHAVFGQRVLRPLHSRRCDQIRLTRQMAPAVLASSSLPDVPSPRDVPPACEAYRFPVSLRPVRGLPVLGRDGCSRVPMFQPSTFGPAGGTLYP